MTSGAQTASLVPLTKMATTISRRTKGATETFSTSLRRFLGNATSQCMCLEIGRKMHSWKIASRPSNFCAHQKYGADCE